jgi:spore coat protein A, manganese oxidase
MGDRSKRENTNQIANTREKKMKKRIAVSLIALFLLLAGISGTQATQVLLPGSLIPKFVDPLPVAGDISVVNATSKGTPSYNIHMREFQAQILPSTGVPLAVPPIPANTPSWVWGYLTDSDIATGGIRPSYLGPVVVAERGVPAYPTYLNELPLYPAGNVQSLLPIDKTLDWANPDGIDCAPDVNGNYTQTICGLPTYTGPLPDSVHIHGGEVAPAFDGGPDAWFTQGNAKTGIGFPGNTYEYKNGQEEATLWFHPHGFGITRLNVFAGMAGVYPIVDPANPPLATMPHFPDYDIPLILQDRSFDTNGQIFYNLASNPQPNPTVHPFWTPEFIGDVIVVNGKTWPYLNVEPRQYRFRFLNGANARFFDLLMNKGVKFIAIATDNGYLKNAVLTPNLIIGPGERYEVIVDFSELKPGTVVTLSNAARTPFPGGAKPTADTALVMQFRVNKPLNTEIADTTIAKGTAIRPTPLQPIINAFAPPAIPPASPAGNIVRQLTLNEVMGPGGPLELVLNNSKYNLKVPADPNVGCTTPLCRETELPAVGDTEIWEIINITADAHPMHTHLTSFQLLDRTPFRAAQWINQYDALLTANGVLPGGGPPNQYNVRNADGSIGGNPAIKAFLQSNKKRLPLPYEMGWKDTVIAYPGEVTRIVVRWAPQDAPVIGDGAPSAGTNLYPFDPTALINGVGYVWHCHILDHEDNEMMRTYTVMPTRQPVQ